MFKTAVAEIIDNVWPLLVIVSVIIISFRITYIIKYKEKVVFYKEILMYGFIIYVICLFYVVTFQDVSWSTSNYVPFKEMFRYRLGSRMFYKNVIGNMLMFLPYGFFASYFLKLKKSRYIILLSLLVSVTIETIQSMIGRVFDVDDIILNVIGGTIGFYLFNLIYYLKNKSPEFLKKNAIYNIITVIIVFLCIFYLISIIGDYSL